ncbi:MAG: hypothetical protein ACOCWZ_03695 [Spirochaetota bacterium]
MKLIKSSLILSVFILYLSSITAFAEDLQPDVKKSQVDYSIHSAAEFDTQQLKAIESMNSKLFKSIQQDKPRVMYDMSIPQAREQGMEVFESFYTDYGKVLRENEINLVKNFFVKVEGETGSGNFTIPVKHTGNYQVTFPALYAETVISLYSFQHENNQFHITIVYGKDDGKWKLYAFRLGPYKLLDQNASDLYKKARVLDKKGHTVMSLLWLSNIDAYLKPSPFATYPDEEKILEYRKKLTKKIDDTHSFPIEMTSIESKPKIYTIGSVFVQKDLIPVIKYRSTLYEKSEKELQKEAEAITGKIEKLFPGITVYQNNLLYQIFPPEGEDSEEKKSKAVYTEIK